VWLQRILVSIYVLFCMTLGMALVTLPWLGNWFDEGLVAQWPFLQHLLQVGFVRGAISGLGLVDIWVGVLEAVNYRDQRPPAPGAASGPTGISNDGHQ
jgi:hypothetical protein